MEHWLLSQYSFMRFTPTFIALLASVFLFFRKNRSQTTLLLSIYLFFITLYDLGHFLSYSYFDHAGGYAWWLVGFAAPFAILILIQFAYRFPEHRFKRESYVVLTVTIVLATLGFSHFVYESARAPFLPNEQHYGSLPSIALPPIGLLMYIWAIVVFFRQSLAASRAEGSSHGFGPAIAAVFNPVSRKAQAARNFALIVLLELLHVTILVLFHNFQVFSFLTLNYATNTVYLLVIFLYAIVYINNSPEPTTFMFKLVGTSLLTILLVIGGVGHIALREHEKAYNQEKTMQVVTLAYNVRTAQYDNIPDDVEFILCKPAHSTGLAQTTFARNSQFVIPENLRFWDRPPTLTELVRDTTRGSAMETTSGIARGQRFFTQISGQNYYVFNTAVEDRYCSVGFDYLAYRKRLHPLTRELILAIVGITFAIVIVFPLLFHAGLVRPLNRLLMVVKNVNEGNLEERVPIQQRDEIGYLSDSFNRMIDSIKDARTRLEHHANHLEDMVAERTADLKDANEALVRTRDELWGEMQLARKLQTTLLPAKPEIADYEIAVHMEPAEQVGGDYYDVIKAGGFDWIVIGDVSGHGVPAGLVMLMAQTAIHTVLAGDPTLKTSALLLQINRVITENIKRLKEFKYMTITVLACMRDGVFHHSGLHEDILVYRHESDSVDVIETSGIWLGLGEAEASDITEGQFQVNPGDIMLLYTDGITEARRLSEAEQGPKKRYDRFGHERLVDTLKRSGRGSPEEVKNVILDELGNFDCVDDVTMLILRRIR